MILYPLYNQLQMEHISKLFNILVDIKKDSDTDECKEIKRISGVKDKILFYYISKAKNMVILTGTVFIKLEDDKIVSKVEIKDIEKVEHENNGVFAWDKVKVILKNGKIETFGIIFSNVTAFFVKEIQSMVGKLWVDEIDKEEKLSFNRLKIYCLKLGKDKLGNDKYYIGATEQTVENRIKNHRDNIKSCEWVQTYKVIELLECIENANEFDEIKYTLIYMRKYGKENVRGETYCQMIFPSHIDKEIDNHLRGASKLCYRCGMVGHFVKDCNINTIIENCYSSEKGEILPCTRCGRNNHIRSRCYAKTHLNGHTL